MADAPTQLAAQIFVADDEELLLELAEAILTREGFRVRTFRDPNEAAQAFAAADRRPGLLVTDYAMGEMTGLDLIETCRALEPGLKVILVSGTVDATIADSTTQPIQAFLRKPYDPLALARVARTLLGV